MRLLDLILHDWRTRLSRPAALASLALFAAALSYGAVSGRMHRDARLQTITRHRADVSATMAGWLADLRPLSGKGPGTGAPPWAGSAMDVTFATYLSPAPLADFAIGQSDLLPSAGAVSLWSPDIRLFSRYELDDPTSLSLGAFDLGKAILFLLPLVLAVLSFDVLSSDRDAGRLGLLLAQGVPVRALVCGRLLARAGAALGITFLVSLAALAAPGGDASLAERLPFFLLWAVSVLLYGAFWAAIIAFVAAGNRRGEVNAMLLLLVWAGLTLILPASAAAVAEATIPPPSRLACLAQARDVEIRTELAEADSADRDAASHPEIAVDKTSDMPAHVRTAFLVTSAVDKATGPVLADFTRAAARRDETLAAARYLSPAIVVHGLFNDIAGNAAASYRRYVAAARDLKAAYADLAGPVILAGRRLPLEDVASLPTFRLDREGAGAVLRRGAGALLFLALAAGLVWFLADRRLRRVTSPG